MNNPLFSIVVPIYNVEKYLEKCVNSILNQKFEDFELILVDDGSPDNCPVICDMYARKDCRIRVIHKDNGGLVSARNAGVKEARGKYVAYVDGDDWVADRWLEILYLTVRDKYPDIVSYNAYKSIDGKNELLTTSNYIGEYEEENIRTQIIPHMLHDENMSFYHFGILPAVWAKIVKTEILKRNLCGDDRITFGEDVACAYDCILDAKSYIGLDDALYYYRQNRESMTKAYDSRRFERIQVLFQYLEKTILKREDTMREQYANYKVFCVFYAVLNEAKNEGSFFEIAKKCHDRMRQYEYDTYIKQFYPKNLGLFWKIIYGLILKNQYAVAIMICRLAVKVKYSYKN